MLSEVCHSCQRIQTLKDTAVCVCLYDGIKWKDFLVSFGESKMYTWRVYLINHKNWGLGNETGYRCLLCAVFMNGFCSSQPCFRSCSMLLAHFSHCRYCFLPDWYNYFWIMHFQRAFANLVSKRFREGCADIFIHRLVTIQKLFKNKISNYFRYPGG